MYIPSRIRYTAIGECMLESHFLHENADSLMGTFTRSRGSAPQVAGTVINLCRLVGTVIAVVGPREENVLSDTEVEA